MRIVIPTTAIGASHFALGKIRYLPFFVVLGLVALAFVIGCTQKAKSPNSAANNFPVNDTIAAQLAGQGIPLDVAQFFASAKVETSSPDDTTVRCLQTFPNGATREIFLQVHPNAVYTPTAADSAASAQDSIQIYGFQYASSLLPDSSTRINMSYYVAAAGLPKALAKNRGRVSLPPDKIRVLSLLKISSGTAGGEGAGISWVETGKRGADVGIGSLLEYAEAHHIELGPTGSIYALASALSDITDALEISQQTNDWLAELDALENCAANPTSQVARSDPNYSSSTVAAIQNARNELKQNSAVRFLNRMTETASGLTPVTAVLSVGMKPGFVWSEQTLKDLSSNLLQNARNAVVPCSSSPWRAMSMSLTVARPHPRGGQCLR